MEYEVNIFTLRIAFYLAVIHAIIFLFCEKLACNKIGDQMEQFHEIDRIIALSIVSIV